MFVEIVWQMEKKTASWYCFLKWSILWSTQNDISHFFESVSFVGSRNCWWRNVCIRLVAKTFINCQLSHTYKHSLTPVRREKVSTNNGPYRFFVLAPTAAISPTFKIDVIILATLFRMFGKRHITIGKLSHATNGLFRSVQTGVDIRLYSMGRSINISIRCKRHTDDWILW